MDFDGKKGLSEHSNVDFNTFKAEERLLVGMFQQVVGRLKDKYEYSNEDLFKIWNNEELGIPVSVFAGKLSPAEALAKYLKENYELGFSRIAELIGRDERSIWANYQRAVKKMPWPFDIKESLLIPVSVFKNDNSILESLVLYLRDIKQLKNKKIAQMLNKNPANVWTVYNRAKKKSNGSNE